MSHKKSNQTSCGRQLSFDVFELLRAAGGFGRDDSHVVMPIEIADQIREELERLYSVQETAVLLREYLLEHFPEMADASVRSGLVSLLETIKREAVE